MKSSKRKKENFLEKAVTFFAIGIAIGSIAFFVFKNRKKIIDKIDNIRDQAADFSDKLKSDPGDRPWGRQPQDLHNSKEENFDVLDE